MTKEVQDEEQHHYETDAPEEEPHSLEHNYKIAEKKAISEYVALDAEDDSLTKWKRSLGLNLDNPGSNSIGAPGDERRLVVLQIRVDLEDHEPIILDVQDPVIMDKFRKDPVVVKEKAKFTITVRFRIQHEIMTGLRYLQVARRKGIVLSKTDEPVGSFPPNTKDRPWYEKSLPTGEAPSGLFARGTYTCSTKFLDDDKYNHEEIIWKLIVGKR